MLACMHTVLQTSTTLWCYLNRGDGVVTTLEHNKSSTICIACCCVLALSDSASALQATDSILLPFTNTSNDGRQLDIVLNITLTPPPAASVSGSNSTFETGIILTHDSTASTRVLLNGTIIQSNSSVWTVNSLSVFVNRTLTGGATNVTYQGGFEGGAVSVPGGGLALDDLSLRVLVDHSLLEVFANYGRGRIASRIYPLSRDRWTAAVFAVLQSAASVTVDAAVYAMESCWVASVT